MKVSLLIATYNWPEALLLVLESVKNQSVLPNEIIIADDGSNNETRQVIENFRTTTVIELHHIWQEDIGFRLAEIRNKAIVKSQFEYIIQIDGDVILHKDYIKDHIYYAAKNTFITGPRVLLLKETTQFALTSKITKFNPFTRNIKNRFNAIHAPLINQLIRPKKTPVEKLIFKVRGCNMSFWRQDLLDINGYEEDFKTWGREDSDLSARLIKKGVALRKLRLAGIQYHLNHNEQEKNNIEQNNAILDKNKKATSFWCENGISKQNEIL
ncbi:Chondroitin synthase [Flavobacterium sp. CECT 9288]|jgi:glycosyltransferase involved in cell wall biosynthesis|uniref:glycosyltransferase family 2 protein n=1 Tax=Flavobacterium sp. CECT 9288 TaxID=2845819 RepID=UPI001E42C06E|nr:glycosyltransferase family 2 protein [Flavobacterium sp. CECT 9288]CAH0336293.1 Chondroitin synthase [Flavobacterium sp. CECT 9288]